MAFAVIGLLVVCMGLGLASLAAWKHTAERGRTLERLARANGLVFSHDDLAAVSTLPFDLFEQGDGNMVHNVITGETADGLPVRVFDFTYFVERTDPDDWDPETRQALKLNTGEARRYHRFSCCVTEMRTAWPHLIIDPQTFGRRILNKLGLHDIDVESEAFNRSYAITCEDRRFAELLVDPGIADLVLGTDKKFRFEIRGRWLLSATERVPAELALPMMKLNHEFLRRVPQLLRAEYPEIEPEGNVGGWVGPDSPEHAKHGIDLGPAGT